MNNKIKLMIGLNVLAIFLSYPSFAKEKKINFNTENVIKAQKILAQHKALLSGPEMLKRYQRLASALAKNK
ncbi:MAG: hypothetical protein A2267_10560 [Omnitrophica WOR_2 bacterium RIFOXYA12_FULL_38_10]|nr:MAG: hypothetical protein A2267_10560 [Omnitrophica WOR_2 bacterium RIFOXYA12_FULL_38_10]HBG61946.1 hypothetical protein [Candidatus Omnitrophota bacterium]